MQKRILVVRTDRVGDVIMITPLIREIRKTFPDAYIASLTTPNTADILINNPYLDLSLTDDFKKNTFWKVIKEIHKQKFTHGLLVMPTERAAYQMYFGRVKYRIGVGKKLYELITFMKSVSRNKYIPLRHEADYSMDLARAIGVKTNDLTPEIFLKSEEREAVRRILVRAGVNEGDFKVIVHTGSGNSSRNWSEEKYFRLIETILEKKNDVKIILTANEMSLSFKEKVKMLNNDSVIFENENINRLRDLISIIANADLLIASSTGPLHVASALNVKTIGLYCHRRMNCAMHWGALGCKALNLEVSKEYCDLNCSIDKEICNFEEGISIDEVLKNI
ncbi:MAG: glycosyltransferase family 9 protein [Bacteroidota bacterium]|nr:glycosyltransferase family 9 protein [Bacteroidota bacterium]